MAVLSSFPFVTVCNPAAAQRAPGAPIALHLGSVLQKHRRGQISKCLLFVFLSPPVIMLCPQHSNCSTASDSSVINTRQWQWQQRAVGDDSLCRPGLCSRLPWRQSLRCTALVPPRPSLPAHPGGPAPCYYCPVAALAAAQTPQRLHRKTQMSASVCLQLRDLSPALELAMDRRCKEGWCPALGKSCQAPYGTRVSTMWLAQ